jgi:hypothetical protein
VFAVTAFIKTKTVYQFNSTQGQHINRSIENQGSESNPCFKQAELISPKKPEDLFLHLAF